MADRVDLATLKRRRGTAKASITRLTTKIAALETAEHEAATTELAQQYLKRLETVDSNFKTHHLAIMDLAEEGEQLQSEQEVLDQHDDDIMNLSLKLRALLTSTRSSTPESHSSSVTDRPLIERRLAQLQARLTQVQADVTKLSGDPNEIHLAHLHHEQMSDLKRELTDIRNKVLVISNDLSDVLYKTIDKQEKEIYEISVRINKAIYNPNPVTTSLIPDSPGVKLPKIDVPSFNGELLQWQTFWEQFQVAIHNRSDVSTTEKLVYLRQALKDSPAKSVVEGLAHTGDQYMEAIACLQNRYNRPRFVHQTHVKIIYEVASLKEGSGKEIRRFHDTVQQHLRALKATGHEPSGPFITSLLELKLDRNTMFEWQKASQDSEDVPHYNKLLEFLDLRAQASETCSSDSKGHSHKDGKSFKHHVKPIPSLTAQTASTSTDCLLYKTQKHPLYTCPQFKSLPHDKMLSTVRFHNLCLNCLKPGHGFKNCSSNNRCKRCQKFHHTLLHTEAKVPINAQQREQPLSFSGQQHSSTLAVTPTVSTNAQSGSSGSALLMTCQILVYAPDGTYIRARGLLDSGSSTSFVSERLAQTLCLHRTSKNVRISGIAGITHGSPLHSIATFTISPMHSPSEKLQLSAIVVPQVTCNLPVQPVPFNTQWNHLASLKLADPDFGQPNKIDILLGVDVYVDVVLQGRRKGQPGTPVAFETKFGWVLAGSSSSGDPLSSVTSNHVTALTADDTLRKFWEIEESPTNVQNYSPEEQSVVRHFAENHSRADSGRFIVPLPKKPNAQPLGESRSMAVRRFLSLERTLHSKNQFAEFATVMQEYMDLKHAEPVPTSDFNKPSNEVFYMPMHAVRKEDSTTTKLRVVFDASAKTSTGVSLNDTLQVGPTVHSSLIDVLLQFRLYRVALTTDVSKMYRAVELAQPDQDLHRFVWRSNPNEPLKDFRMTRVTFGVSASPFAANMAVKQNAADHAVELPLAAKVVERSFYVDDGLTGADSVREAIQLQQQLQTLFDKGGFLLRKWNSSHPEVLQHISPDLKDPKHNLMMPFTEQYSKTLGIEWNSTKDYFRLTICESPPTGNITKRALVSDIAKTFDVLGWFAPSTIIAKMLLQKLWERKVDWDDPVPTSIQETWTQWRSELPTLSQVQVPRHYFNKLTTTTSVELHGFSDASEAAYAAVVYIRATSLINTSQIDHTISTSQITLVVAKTKVAPIKKLTIPRLELCGAHLLAQLLHHTRQVLEVPLSHVHAWTDSTIVLNWLDGNPKRFKTYVGNRIYSIIDLIPPERWKHVSSSDNPADCASRGLYPSELIQHDIWWNGPSWLKDPPSNWPKKILLPKTPLEVEEKEISLHVQPPMFVPVFSPDKFSCFDKMKRVTAWILRFVKNTQSKRRETCKTSPFLTFSELQAAENYWVHFVQTVSFSVEIQTLKINKSLPSSSPLRTLNPFLDDSGLLRVGGRRQLSKAIFPIRHPLILPGKHTLTHLIIRNEHLRLLHANVTFLTASLHLRFHIIGGRRVIKSVARQCITCRKYAARPTPQMLGQLPAERLTPGPVFDTVGIDYAGPVLIKYGHVRKPTFIKAYICVFVSLTVKAVHIELVTDLTTEAFLACLRRFIARRGRPSIIWSDNGTNFTGAARELKELFELLRNQFTQYKVAHFLTSQNITWKFIPQHTPHFGGLWEAAVKSVKYHLKRIVDNVKLTYEEYSTLLSQIESCLNSRPIAPLTDSEDCIEALTPGHFLIGRPLEALPDKTNDPIPISLLKRWQLCQNLMKHFWKRWSSEYITHLNRFNKWYKPTRNLQEGDLVIIHEDTPLINQWPLARVVKIHPGKDNLVRVATIKTSTGVYTRPVTKLALLLPCEEQNRPK